MEDNALTTQTPSLDPAKPWYRSRTVWAAIVTIGASVAGLFGLGYSSAEQAEVVDTLVAVTTAISGAVALIGRLVARDRIGK